MWDARSGKELKNVRPVLTTDHHLSYPQVFAAGGRADPERPGSGLARVVGLGYTGMAAGPALIGLVADQIGLHLALLIPLALAAWIAVAALVLRASAPEPALTPPDPVSPAASSVIGRD